MQYEVLFVEGHFRGEGIRVRSAKSICHFTLQFLKRAPDVGFHVRSLELEGCVSEGCSLWAELALSEQCIVTGSLPSAEPCSDKGELDGAGRCSSNEFFSRRADVFECWASTCILLQVKTAAGETASSQQVKDIHNYKSLCCICMGVLKVYSGKKAPTGLWRIRQWMVLKDVQIPGLNI